MELVERTVEAAGHRLPLLMPPDPMALLDEDAFDHEEYLPYWAELWASGPALAAALTGPAGPALAGLRALELGCGLGVPSLVAALEGADVLATDWSPEAVEVLGRNARACGAELAIRRFGWTDDPAALGPRFPLVVAADVLYERRNGPQLLALLPQVLAPGGEVWIADPGRAAAPHFFEAAAAGWALDEVPHDGPPAVTVHRLRRASGTPG